MQFKCHTMHCSVIWWAPTVQCSLYRWELIKLRCNAITHNAITYNAITHNAMQCNAIIVHVGAHLQLPPFLRRHHSSRFTHSAHNRHHHLRFHDNHHHNLQLPLFLLWVSKKIKLTYINGSSSFMIIISCVLFSGVSILGQDKVASCAALTLKLQRLKFVKAW